MDGCLDVTAPPPSFRDCRRKGPVRCAWGGAGRSDREFSGVAIEAGGDGLGFPRVRMAEKCGRGPPALFPVAAELRLVFPRRKCGVLVSQETGRTTAFALFKLQERACFFVGAGTDVYEGMIVGENARDNDLVVNPVREKKLTNMRSSGADEMIQLEPPRDLSLELALEYIEADEYVEITPNAIRLRKILLTENERKRGNRALLVGAG